MIRVVIADDQRLMREGLKVIFDLEEDIEVVGLAADGQEAVTLVKQHQPHVVLMDIRMPQMDGVEGAKRIQQLDPKVKVLMLTTFNDKELIIAALQNGAKGYLLKDMPSAAIIQAIHTVYRGGVVMQPDVTERILTELKQQNKQQRQTDSIQLAENKKLAELTEREKEVLSLLGLGHNNKEIAKKLFISEGTVKNYISAVIRKLELRDRTQAALFALKTGIIKE